MALSNELKSNKEINSICDCKLINNKNHLHYFFDNKLYEKNKLKLNTITTTKKCIVIFSGALNNQ